MLKSNDWFNENYEILKDLIEKYKSKDETEKYKRNYIVSDWDNTSCMFDVEDAVFLYQLFNLEFNMTNEEFNLVIKKDIDIEKDSFNESLILSLQKDYEVLNKMKLEYNIFTIKSKDIYKNFVAKMAYLYKDIADQFSYDSSCKRILYLFSGMTEEELRDLTKRAIEYWLNFSPQLMEFSFEWENKIIKTFYQVGLSPIEAQMDLYRNCRLNNIDVYICSASSEVVVEEIATDKKIGYGFERGQIAGLHLEKDIDGKYIPKLDEGKIKTYFEGKAEFVKTLEEKYKKPPIMFMGDSDGDYNALTYPGLKVGLIVNIKKSGHINELKEIARLKEFKDTIYILQGRDEYKGQFIKSEDSLHIKTGA